MTAVLASAGSTRTAPPTGHDRLLPRRPATSWPDHLTRLGPLPLEVAPQLAELLTSAALSGRGGGGFPTARKLAAVAAHSVAGGSSTRRAVVVANCCEGDPTSSKDAVLLANSPHLVIDGALLAAAAVGADRVILAVHSGSAAAADLPHRIAERGTADRGTADRRTADRHDDDRRDNVAAVIAAPSVDIEVVQIPPRFVASEATALVRFINSGDARPAGRLSRIWESGIDGRPTLVDNAETLAQLALIGRFGPSWFTSVGTAAEPGTVLVTVGGAVSRPGVVEVAGGTPLQRILDTAGAVVDGTGPTWALVGGLAGRWIDLTRTSRTGFAAGKLSAVGGTKGVASLIVLPPGGCLLGETARILAYLADSGARQCGPCMFGLPAIAADMAALAGADPEAIDRLYRRLPVIDQRGGCGHPDGAVALAASALSAMTGPEWTHLQRHVQAGGCAAPAPVVPLAATARNPAGPLANAGGRL